MSECRYAILGDIHANWEALSAVLEDAAAQGVTDYACVGDIVGYNANPIECLEKVREMQCVCVQGNHDHYCSHDEDLTTFHPMAAEVISWTRTKLNDEQKTWLKHLWYRRAVKSFMLVHATLDMPEKWGYVFDDLDAMTHFSYQITAVCFHGHTHVPVVFEGFGKIKMMSIEKMGLVQGRKYFVNVGSVGQPRDGDPRASYAIYDMDRKEIEIRRIEYDIQAAQKKIVAVGLPEWLAERLATGK